MLFILGSASTAARVPTTAQASTPSREDAASSHMMDCMTREKRKKHPSGFGSESANRGWERFRIRGRRNDCSRVSSVCTVDRLYGKFAAVFDAAKLGAVVCD